MVTMLPWQAADELGCNLLGGAGEEGWGKGLKVMGRRGGYGSGLGDGMKHILMHLARR